MLIHNDIKRTSLPETNAKQDVKEGGTYQATVKEKLPNNEAIVVLKGEDVKVKYEGNLPESGKITLKVTDMKQDLPVVKMVTQQPLSSEQSVRQANPTISENVRQAIQLLHQQNIPISREALQNIKTYIEKAQGTQEQKLETITQMVGKKLHFKPAQIKAIHEAIHGERLGQVLNDLASKLDTEFKVQETPESLNIKIEQLIRGSGLTVQSDESPIEAIIKEALRQVKTTADFSRFIQFIKNTTLEALPESQELSQAVEKAEQLFNSGRELAARQEIMSALNTINQEQNNMQIMQADGGEQVENIEFNETSQVYRISGELLATIPIQSRDIIVTTITEKLSQAALDFTKVKRDISNALQSTEHLLKQAPVQARTSLEAAIRQLDHAILKSDFMLYTDMGTEKKLLVASSKLHEARKMLETGNFSKASEIVQQVKTTVDKLIFQPSDVRIKHYVSKEMIQLEPLPKQFSMAFEEPLQTFRQEPTARHLLEYARSLGLMHDTDVAHRLVSGENTRSEIDANVKNMLMKLIQAEGNNSTGQRAEQALNNITGQQLLSKSDHAGLQTMMFSLPIILKDQVENVKVFLKSNNRNEKIDWENCSLYFLLETKRMGDVGVLLTAVDRTLSVTIKNDRQGFKEKMKPVTEIAKTRLEEIGYHLNSIQYTTLTPSSSREKETEQVTKKQPAFTERGYDFTV